MVELGNQRAKFFEEGNADLFEVALAAAGYGVVGIDSIDALDIAIESNGLGLRGNLPLGGSQENGEMVAIDLREARRDGSGLQRMFDGGEKNRVAGDVEDDAATCEIGDDFAFLLSEEGRSRGEKQDQ